MLTSMRPDRALATTPMDAPRELFKDQSVILLYSRQLLHTKFRPIEAAVVMLPLYEFIRSNPKFPSILVDAATSPAQAGLRTSTPFSILSLSSYILSHATSTSSPRSLAYANLCLNSLLALAERSEVMDAFCQPSSQLIRLCRQVCFPLAG